MERIRVTYLLHSPGLAEQRAESVKLLEEALPHVKRVTSDEPSDIIKTLGSICDVDPANVRDEAFRARSSSMLHIRQVSNAMKHYRAICHAAASLHGDDDLALVVEDDALFGNDVRGSLSRAISDAPRDVDVLFLGLPSPSQPSQGKSTSFSDLHQFFGGVLPACESYVVNKRAARALADAFLPIRFATNVHVSYLIKVLSLKALLTSPNVFVDGSKLGVFPGTVDPSCTLPWNQAYMKMNDIVRSHGEYGPQQHAALMAAMEEQRFKGHPAVLALLGAHFARKKMYQEARQAYDVAIDVMDRGGCVLGSQSTVLREAISLYRHLQDSY